MLASLIILNFLFRFSSLFNPHHFSLFQFLSHFAILMSHFPFRNLHSSFPISHTPLHIFHIPLPIPQYLVLDPQSPMTIQALL